MTEHLILAAITTLAALATALVALILFHAYLARRAPAAILEARDADETVFLFDGGTLLDATASARRLLADAPAAADDRARLVARLGPRFPDLADQLAELHRVGVVAMRAQGDALMTLTAEWQSGLTRLTLSASEALAPYAGAGVARLQVMEDELAELRHAVAAAPVLIWRETAAGQVTWANGPYFDRLGPGAALSWPLPRLFDAGEADDDPVRCTLMAGTERESVFECHRSRLPDGDRLCYALPADAAARAEASLRDFRQTLTRTFAQLPVGIAVFDARRQLQMFNPALTDMTGLEAAFLAARPTLGAFLDRLRESRILPEPRDYRSWCKRIADIDAAAATGDFEESWTTPSGQTHRVLGRPHPDGAIALLFDDVSSELSLTCRFRAELELGHEVLDSLDEAIAVFSPARLLVMSNAAYARLWGTDPSVSAGQTDLAEALALWRRDCAPGALWDTLEDFAATSESRRAPGTGQIALHDGRVLQCRFTPLSGGAFLIGFRDPTTAQRTQTPPMLVHARSS